MKNKPKPKRRTGKKPFPLFGYGTLVFVDADAGAICKMVNRGGDDVDLYIWTDGEWQFDDNIGVESARSMLHQANEIFVRVATELK